MKHPDAPISTPAIGRSVGPFDISDHPEEAGGRIHDTVKTRDGVTYRCCL